jgi:uncharacterized protein (TIGR03083 family)
MRRPGSTRARRAGQPDLLAHKAFTLPSPATARSARARDLLRVTASGRRALPSGPGNAWPSSAILSTVTASEPAEPAPARDPYRPARLLQAERDALVPILDRTPGRAFDRPTACPGWSVRDVLAHCAAALSRVAAGNLHAFTPALNELDVARRRGWPLTDILAELSAGYQEAGKAITDAGGKLDVIALGEWLHGGDIRDALGEPLAYASDGFDDACALLCNWTRRQAIPQPSSSCSDKIRAAPIAGCKRPAHALAGQSRPGHRDAAPGGSYETSRHRAGRRRLSAPLLCRWRFTCETARAASVGAPGHGRLPGSYEELVAAR